MAYDINAGAERIRKYSESDLESAIDQAVAAGGLKKNVPGSFGKFQKDLYREFLTKGHNLVADIWMDQTISQQTKLELFRDLETIQAKNPALFGGEDVFDTEHGRRISGFRILQGGQTKTFEQVESLFKQAQAGEGKFGSRQKEEQKRKALTERPGERQFLIPNNRRTKPASPVLFSSNGATNEA